MCELLGMSACHPSDLDHSLALLRPRGGEIGPHADGWGIAFYDGRAARILKEPVPAAGSPCLELLVGQGHRSRIVIAHIRKANPPEVGRAAGNTHPFERELGGRSWTFAHNGKLPGVMTDSRFRLGRFRPIGDTDSEHAFCYLLRHIEEAGAGDAEHLARVLREPLSTLATLGILNVLMSEGEHLVAFATTRLHMLTRRCEEGGCAQQVALLATEPLTEEPWSLLAPGIVHVLAGGRVVATA